ncbi:peptidase C1A papain [Methanolacinia petrolearia DSM 11571]|uniref:Peptidase C1A papain n=1 Tax=Methanolacinia petrolearia (strain DSM 11571 / OCM 486 / SEBR 4847) TaxID=679926 RepID=E1RJR2_METP4|nr:peptidase C1 [Methanolacinia petrolearia]ADN35709.1 peptidase C1A papain [Methanolacinia petrolearia DSM 11571]
MITTVMMLLLIVTPVIATNATVFIDCGNISEIGDSTTIYLTLDNAPQGLSGYNLNVSLDNTSIAEITGVSFPDWAANMSTHGALPAGSGLLIKASDVNYLVEPGATSITLATLTLKGLRPGSTEITMANANFDDDNGSDIPHYVSTGTLSVDYTPAIFNITPDSGYNNGSVNFMLNGSWLMSGASVNLTRGDSSIPAVNLSYVSETQIDGIFDINGLDEGRWNVTVTNPDGKKATLTDGFTIIMSMAPVNGVMPTDPNGDGIYEDLNGNAQADYADVNIFFVSYSWIEGNEPEDAFDFNNNGRLDMADIVVLFDSIS